MEAARIVPRRMGFPFDATIPRYWMAGSPLATHIVNGLNLIFPLGERFFVRSVRYYLDRIDDPELCERVRGFFGQEGSHAREHERFFTVLEEQGYDVRSFLDWYERIAFGKIEPFHSPEMRLAVTAAAEHFTAIMAEYAFEDDFLERAHPIMRDLLRWHAAEEIEHKSVAFDVLQKVDPSYGLRMRGLALATVLLATFWIAATVSLIRQERGSTRKAALRELDTLRNERPIGRRVFARGIREYMRRDFHPSQIDNAHLAREYLASIGRAEG